MDLCISIYIHTCDQSSAPHFAVKERERERERERGRIELDSRLGSGGDRGGAAPGVHAGAVLRASRQKPDRRLLQHANKWCFHLCSHTSLLGLHCYLTYSNWSSYQYWIIFRWL